MQSPRRFSLGSAIVQVQSFFINEAFAHKGARLFGSAACRVSGGLLGERPPHVVESFPVLGSFVAHADGSELVDEFGRGVVALD